MPQIHPTAIVSPSSQIAEDVEIGPFCIIEDNVVIGTGTKLYNNVSVYSGARIGNHNTIFPGAVIAAVPQDLKFGGEYSEVHIGNNNTIREYVTINRGTAHSGKTEIANHCLLMAYTHIAHDCSLGSYCILANSVALGGHVHIEEYVIIGGLTGVHQFVKIGRHCMIGAHSMLVKDVPPYTMFSGDPLAYKGLNVIGLRRRGFSDGKIKLIKHAYKLLYESGFNVTQAISKIKDEPEQTIEVENIISFIESSSRGITK